MLKNVYVAIAAREHTGLELEMVPLRVDRAQEFMTPPHEVLQVPEHFMVTEVVNANVSHVLLALSLLDLDLAVVDYSLCPHLLRIQVSDLSGT